MNRDVGRNQERKFKKKYHEIAQGLLRIFKELDVQTFHFKLCRYISTSYIIPKASVKPITHKRHPGEVWFGGWAAIENSMSSLKQTNKRKNS